MSGIAFRWQVNSEVRLPLDYAAASND